MYTCRKARALTHARTHIHTPTHQITHTNAHIHTHGNTYTKTYKHKHKSHWAYMHFYLIVLFVGRFSEYYSKFDSRNIISICLLLQEHCWTTFFLRPFQQDRDQHPARGPRDPSMDARAASQSRLGSGTSSLKARSAAFSSRLGSGTSSLKARSEED